MSFAETVMPVRSCPGVEVTAISDRDGIAVETWGVKAHEVEELIAEYANFLREVSNANRELQLGELEQVIVTADRRTVIVTAITDGYYLMTVLNRDGLAGKARFASRVAAFRLRKEFV